MEFLSERILRLAGLSEEESQILNEGLAEEPVASHQPYQTIKSDESLFYADEDDSSDTNEIDVDYAIKESSQALVESRLRDAIRMELKAILAETDSEDVTDEEEEGPRWGATGLKKVVRGQRKVHMGGVGVGFASWKQN